MRYLSLFSGIEAATVAWEPLGWEPVAFCEVDAFPSAVLAYRFPNVPNLGDIRKVNWDDFKREYGTPELIVGGSPCQSFSIAGNRSGLAGASGLMFEYLRAVREVKPPWVVWENVPGALSVERGHAFAQLLDSLGECGYEYAWRVLDAQFFGVAQRRKRVFVVASLRGGGAPAEVLFEPESLRRDYETNAEKRASLTAGIQSGAAGDSIGIYGDGTTSLAAHGSGLQAGISPTLNTIDRHSVAVRADSVLCVQDGQRDAAACVNLAPTLNASHENPIVCIADDNANAAIDIELSGTLKRAGGAPFVIQRGQNEPPDRN